MVRQPPIPNRKPIIFGNAFAPPVHSNTKQLFQQGVTLHQQGQLMRAKWIYDQVLKKQPDHFDALHLSGLIAAQNQNPEMAIQFFQKAIHVNPNNAAVHYNNGVALQEVGHANEALQSYDNAIVFQSNHADAHHNRGNVLRSLNRSDEAIESYSKAIEIRPNYAEAYFNMGVALQNKNSLQEALTCFEKTVQIQPQHADAYYKCGVVLHQLQRVEEAISNYQKAIHFRPIFADAYYNQGIALTDLNFISEALDSYDTAIALKPNYADAYANRGLLKMLRRDFLNGVKDYAYRWTSSGFHETALNTSIPAVSDKKISGRVLIWAEQGLGDEVFCAGFLPLLLDTNVSVTLSADKRLFPVFKRSFPDIELIDRKLLKESPPALDFDFQASICDFGFLLESNLAVLRGSRRPYFQIDKSKSAGFRTTLKSQGNKLVCGFAWKSANKSIGNAKSIEIKAFEPLLRLSDIQFVNLQYGDISNDLKEIETLFSRGIFQMPGIDIYNDIDDLLALMDACDVIVTTSNVTAHLAGAIGKQAVVLIPYSNGRIWYWHENESQSFWYPSLKLFRQDNLKTWQQPIQDCSEWIKGLL